MINLSLKHIKSVTLALCSAALLAACGGGGGGGAEPPVVPPVVVDPNVALGNNTSHQAVLSAVPANADGGGGNTGGGAATGLTVHYRRLNGDTTGWQLHSWNAAQDPGWNNGHNPSGSDAFGAIYEVPLAATSGDVGYLFHKGDTKDHGGADQKHTLAAGKNEIWRIEGDSATYATNPLGSLPPDLTTVRVHYLRYQADHANWGLHLWAGSGLDAARVPAGKPIDQWGNPVPFTQMANYSAANGAVVFDIPVLNPKDDAGRTSLEFIIHGMPPKQDDKDGRANNIRISYGSLAVRNQVAEVWLVEQDSTVYLAAPDLRSSSLSQARAVWLNKQLLQWPRVDNTGTVKLYHSARGQVVARIGQAVSGHDGVITLEPFTGTVPSSAATRFKWVGAGSVWAVKAADQAQLATLLKSQLVLVQEDGGALVRNATTTQTPGALDDLYAAAGALSNLGVQISGGNTRFTLWAPTAQKVMVFTYDTALGEAVTADVMAFDTATGAWSAQRTGDLSGKYYLYAVDVFVRGVGLVRNWVTDPYSISLSANSARSYVAQLDSAALKPAGWDASTPPAKVAAAPDMAIYELHVRDFSANDTTVSAANRGKYGAFTEPNANGMKHLKALADAGLTDVHLLPVFDIASVPEGGCTTPSPSGAADATTQQATVAATAAGDCFNWGYDPWHFTAPEGSYATDAANGARRVLEFRQMVKALHDAGLRVGMDVVYNHTTASGQNAKSVLDRIVPGYYHRLDGNGAVTQSTCCENTAAENLMMGKLLIDSVVTWAKEYKISSFRFDVMGHHPRAVMEALKTRLRAAVGREVQLLGEGWNFGEVADGARFVQATQWSLNGSGIGTFSHFARDAIRGGSPFDSGNGLIANQGFVNGLFYDANALGSGRSRTDLMWQGDIVKAGLAGSIRSFSLTTHWDATLTLENLQVNGQPAGYVVDPAEVVNYFENHDNQTMFDNNVFKLPVGTSTADRARVQMLAVALNSLSQGVAYFHAGVDTLRSKSLDRNSYDAGDWFNRLDWGYADNNFGVGLPGNADNGSNWSVMQPLLANSALKPQPGDVAWMRDVFRDWLKVRQSTTLLRLRTADDIKARLSFHNTGAGQVETVIVGRVDGTGYAGAGFKELVYLVNVDKVARSVTVDALKGRGYVLHPALQTGADAQARQAGYTAASGRFDVPARSAAVFVVN